MKITHINEKLGLVYAVDTRDHVSEYDAEKINGKWRLTEHSAMCAGGEGVQFLLDRISDNVNEPQHYMLLDGVQVIDVRRALLKKIPAGTSFESVDHWSRCWEYITRMWGKNGLEDAKKARVYLDWLIESMEK